MRLYELQQKDIESQLQGVGQGIADRQNSPDPMGAGAGQETPQQQPEPKPEEDINPVSAELMAAIKGLPYVSNYQHKEDSPIYPMRVLNMGMPELEKLRNLVRTKIGMKTFSDKVGLYADDGMKFFQDLIEFVDRTMMIKKHGSKAPSEPSNR